MNRAKASDSPLLDLQKVIDNILAFWGMIDDAINEENIRNTIKIGKRLERINLYARLQVPKEEMLREINRFLSKLDASDLIYNQERLEFIAQAIKNENLNYPIILENIEQILEMEQ